MPVHTPSSMRSRDTSLKVRSKLPPLWSRYSSPGSSCTDGAPPKPRLPRSVVPRSRYSATRSFPRYGHGRGRSSPISRLSTCSSIIQQTRRFRATTQQRSQRSPFACSPTDNALSVASSRSGRSWSASPACTSASTIQATSSQAGSSVSLRVCSSSGYSAARALSSERRGGYPQAFNEEEAR